MGRQSFSQELVPRASTHSATVNQKYTGSGSRKEGGTAEELSRNRGRLHKLEARQSECLLVKRQRASTSSARSELYDQRVRE